MTSPDPRETILAIFSKIQRLPQAEIDMEADLVKHYGIDSLRAVKLLSTLEVELDIEFPDEDMRSIRTLNDVAALAENRLKQQEETGS
jgi:acyl carrier protein